MKISNKQPLRAEPCKDEPVPRRLTDQELQDAADRIRHDASNPEDWSTLTVTEGMKNGRPVYTVTTSRRQLSEHEKNVAKRVLPPGAEVNFPEPGPDPPEKNSFHAEQRGIRATEDQTERRQASSNQTVGQNPNVLELGAACPECAAKQREADVQNVTGTIEGGGRKRSKP